MTYSGSRCAHLVDDFGDVALEWHNAEWFETALDSALPYLHDALHKYGLREGFLIQDGGKFRANSVQRVPRSERTTAT